MKLVSLKKCKMAWTALGCWIENIEGEHRVVHLDDRAHP